MLAMRASFGRSAFRQRERLAAQARGLLTVADPPQRDEGQIQSAVVDESCRGEGLGGVILGCLEQDAIGLGSAGRCCR
jgi:N-acetylglutamate synthase-like GNAT family acetyltransferase